MAGVQETVVPPLLGATNQWTSSTRFLVFNFKTVEHLRHYQVELAQKFPKVGWVEQDPREIQQSVYKCMETTCEKLVWRNVNISTIKATWVSNQRVTTVMWKKFTGQPLHNALMWPNLRTQAKVEVLNKKIHGRTSFVRSKIGLPLSTYLSAMKIHWLLKNVRKVKKAAEEQRDFFGTIDSWLIWNTTGEITGGIHCTDVTNASRTMLFKIHSLKRGRELCKFFGVPMDIFPDVCSSSEIYGWMKSGALEGVPLSGCLGDQSAALVRQMCFQDGEAKNTYGTGCFLLGNTGPKCVFSQHGLLTTMAYKLGQDKPICYALEGSAAIPATAVHRIKDNLGIIKTMEEIEGLAEEAGTSYGCYFVPAFSGLYAPYWEQSTRGIICEITQFTNKQHIAFAALEAVCFQIHENLDAMSHDCRMALTYLQADRAVTNNKILMQLQADILHIPVVKPSMPKITALGATVAAEAAEGGGIWSLEPEDLSPINMERFEPQVKAEEGEIQDATWKKAVQKSIGWATSQTLLTSYSSIFCNIPLGFFIVSSMVLLIGTRYISRAP